MVKIGKVFGFVLFLVLFTSIVSATQQQVSVQFKEYVNQSVLYNPLKAGSGIWHGPNEQQSNYSLTGYLIVTNTNPNGKTISDIWISLNQTTDLNGVPIHYAGRNGTFVSNDSASNLLVLHIPELEAGQNSTWIYSINTSKIRPILNLTAKYSLPKILAGENLTIDDTLKNEFDNDSYQTNTCIYDINLTQKTNPINFTGKLYNVTFDPSTTGGVDAGNVTYSADNQTQVWNALGGSCLNKGSSTNINYTLNTPSNFPTSNNYDLTDTVLRYKLNQTVSHMRLVDITAVSEANIGIKKRIIGPTFVSGTDTNVTWNVTGDFNTSTNITYLLRSVTLWVSKRNVSGQYTDLNTVDNDTVTKVPLKILYNPMLLVNSTNAWKSLGWTFNYTDVPSPIVWAKGNFTIANDGAQLVNRSITQNNNDFYVKEVYVIVGYWLEINKNITSLGNNSYHVKITVKNKGNFATPANTVVTVYDFVPSNYNVTSPFVFSDTANGWYSTALSNHSVAGQYNGTLYQFGLVPTGNGGMNASLDGKYTTFNENNTWSANFNVTGYGNYKLMDVFITGLDPQKVDGAGSSKSVVVSEILDRISSKEGIFASIASVLLLFGLIL